MATDPLKSSLSPKQIASILDELQTSHDEARNNQIEARRKWNKIEAYVDGRQMTLGGPKFGAFYGHEEAMAPSQDKDIDKELFIANEIKRAYLQKIQTLTSYQLQADVIPPDRSPKKKVAARAARIFLNHVIRQGDAERQKNLVAGLLLKHNFACVKVHWNPNAGKHILMPKKGILGWFLSPDSRPQGEVQFSVISARNLIVPKFTEHFENSDWIEEVRIVTPDHVWRTYGKVVPGEIIRPDYGEFVNTNRGQSEGGVGANGPSKGHVLLKERWIKPCPRYERGAIFVWAGRELLRSSDLLTYYPGLPYFSSQIVLDEKDPFGLSILWDLIPLQNLVNLGISAGARYMGLLALMRMWLPDGCEVTEEQLTNLSGVSIEFKGDKVPQWDKPPEMNQSVLNMVNMARGLISSYGFANELSKSNRAYSGNALGMMSEFDDTVFKPAMDSVQSMWNRGSDFALRLAARHMTVPRMVRMLDMQGWQVAEFKGEMIDEDFKADVRLMTGMPTNKVMRLEFLKALYKDGLLSKEEVKNHLEFATDTEALEDLQKQNEIAEARIEGLLAYPQNYTQESTNEGLHYICKIMYHDFDNHQLLVAKLQGAMQESFDHWNPWIQMAFLEHWDYHKQKALQQAQEQAQFGGGQGGGAPQFPGPPEQPGPPAGGPPMGGGIQSADQQPPPDMQPPPMNGGSGMGGGQ